MSLCLFSYFPLITSCFFAVLLNIKAASSGCVCGKTLMKYRCSVYINNSFSSYFYKVHNCNMKEIVMIGNKKKKIGLQFRHKRFSKRDWKRGGLKASHRYRLLVKQSRQPFTGKWGRRHIPHFNWVRLHDSGNIILFQMLPAFFRCIPPWTCLMFWGWLVCHSINNVCCKPGL